MIDSEKYVNSTIPDGFDWIDHSGGINEYRLQSNDLQILLLPQSTVPVVTFMVTYRVGSRNESLGLTGATHFLEHLMFKGTEKFNKRKSTSVFNVLQRVGAQINATTWFDRTNYYELLPKEHLELAIEIEADRMRGALINEEDIESERTVILNEFDRGQNDPVRNLYHGIWSIAFVAHPYHHPTIGWRSDIENVTADGLRHFYNTYYWPNNATISIIGDFEPEQGLHLVSKYFGSISRSLEAIPEIKTAEPEQRGERRITVRQVGQLGAVMMAFKSPPALDIDVDALDLLSMILSAGKSSRLFNRLTDHGITTHTAVSASRLRDPGLFYLFAFLTPGHTHEEVEKAIWEVLDGIKANGVSDQELQRAKSQLKAQEAFGRDGPFAVAAQLNEAIAAGNWKLYAQYIERINNITADAIQRVVIKYCDERRCSTGFYVPS